LVIEMFLQVKKNGDAGIDVVETPASRRQKTVDPKNTKPDKVDIPRFYGSINSGPNFGGSGNDKNSRPPLHKHASMINDDDRLSQYRDGSRSGRYRAGDVKDNSDIGR